MTDDHSTGRLVDRVHRELREGTTPNRLTSVLTESVPSPVPGRVFLCFARSCSPGADTGEGVMDVAMAVEFAALHQYLHGIPSADALAAPARDSPYADDEVAAIIDSDRLQAAAFARISAGAPTASAARRCYAALAEESIDSYELRGRSRAHDVQPLAPLTAAAGRVGAIVAGLDREAATTAAEVARAIGGSVGVRTPTGTADGDAGAVPDRASLVEELAGIVPNPGTVADALQPLVGAEPAVDAADRAGPD